MLLQQRNKEPEKGYWSIPGGKLEWMETFEDAVKREVKEECGVDIKVEKLLGICDHIVEKENQPEGEPKIMEPTKHIDMQWFDLHTLPENLTITTKHAVRAYTKTHVNEKQK